MIVCLFSILIAFLIMQIEIGAEKKKLEEKTFNEIFGEKWEQKEEEKGTDQNENDMKKRETIRKFNKIKEKIKQKGRKYLTKEWNIIEKKITKKLGTNRKYIYKWIKEFKFQKTNCYKSKTDEQKIEIVDKFIAMKNEYKQKGKYLAKEWDKNNAEICKKIGVNYGTIMRWKKQFGIFERLTEKEKMEKMKIYRQIKGENPKINDAKIAKILQISGISIRRWKKQCEEKK